MFLKKFADGMKLGREHSVKKMEAIKYRASLKITENVNIYLELL